MLLCCWGPPRVPAEAAGLEVPLLHMGWDGGACGGVLAMPKVPAALRVSCTSSSSSSCSYLGWLLL